MAYVVLPFGASVRPRNCNIIVGLTACKRLVLHTRKPLIASTGRLGGSNFTDRALTDSPSTAAPTSASQSERAGDPGDGLGRRNQQDPRSYLDGDVTSNTETRPLVRSVVTAMALALICLVTASSVRATEVKVISANVFTGVLDDVASGFERASGHKVTIVYATAGVVRSRVQSGEVHDVIILPRPMMDELSQQGRVVPGSIINVAHSAVGVAVRSGTPKPDIGSLEALKRSLLAAKTISYADPARGGATGALVTRVLQRLGITDEMKAKTRLPPAGQFAVTVVARSEAEIAVAQPMEVLGQPGVELVGLLPSELQTPANFTFSAGIVPSARDAEASREFLRYLSGPAAAPPSLGQEA